MNLAPFLSSRLYFRVEPKTFTLGLGGIIVFKKIAKI
jgi:hypothetical protein